MSRHVAHAAFDHDDGRGTFARQHSADEDGLPPVGWKMFDHILKRARGRKHDRGVRDYKISQPLSAGAFFQSFCMFSSDMPLLSGTNFQTNRAASTLKPPYSQ